MLGKNSFPQSIPRCFLSGCIRSFIDFRGIDGPWNVAALHFHLFDDPPIACVLSDRQTLLVGRQSSTLVLFVKYETAALQRPVE